MVAAAIPGSSTLFRSYRLQCGIPSLALEIERGLQNLGWIGDEQSQIGLLIDAPLGFALQSLTHACSHEWVVLTDNPCPEYWEDLWSFAPGGLLTGGHSAQQVTDALEHAVLNQVIRRTPHHDSTLSVVERRLLRHSAQGWENKRIAQEVGLTEGAVRNGLSRVFQKLGLGNRTQLALYYWGLWHLLAE